MFPKILQRYLASQDGQYTSMLAFRPTGDSYLLLIACDPSIFVDFCPLFHAKVPYQLPLRFYRLDLLRDHRGES